MHLPALANTDFHLVNANVSVILPSILLGINTDLFESVWLIAAAAKQQSQTSPTHIHANVSKEPVPTKNVSAYIRC